MFFAILAYWMVPIRLARVSPPIPKDLADVTYTIDLDTSNVKGAELWVNGVFLGKTPYTTSLSDFEAKVPYWAKLPAEYEKEKVEKPNYGPRGASPQICCRWIKVSRPTCSFHLDQASQPLKPGEHPALDQAADYFAQVRYAGEWGFGTGNGHGWGGGSGAGWQINGRFDVVFLQRQKRLESLLNMARVAQYHVGPEWFQAAETYEGDVWIALERAAAEEPQMANVRDAWATWRYRLDEVSDADSAWTAFHRICDEADSQQQYGTDSVAGRAVELLAPKLSPERLIDVAVPLIRDTSNFSYSYWQSSGRLQFGYQGQPGVVSAGDKAQFPARGFPVAHAVWMLNQQLRLNDASQPNVIQERITPEIVRRHGQDFNTLPMIIASYFGGPAVDKFLLRERWGDSPDPYHIEDWTYISSQQVNKWLYYLGMLNDDAGRTFRRQHAELFMALADKLHGLGFNINWQDLNFIFLDPWLAKEYWPRFARLARQTPGGQPLQSQWEYLSRMGDAASVEMYVDAWKETRISTADFSLAPQVLEKLKPSQRRVVIDAIVRQVGLDDSNLADVRKSFGGWTQEQAKNEVISALERQDQSAARLSEAEQLLADLQKGAGPDNKAVWQNVPLWLAHTQPDSPLVAMLGDSAKPELRRMALAALHAYPIPPHQELLAKLLKDPDATVRAAAQEVSRQLEKLAAEKPSAYNSAGTSK
jgi:hypothetical protein